MAKPSPAHCDRSDGNSDDRTDALLSTAVGHMPVANIFSCRLLPVFVASNGSRTTVPKRVGSCKLTANCHVDLSNLLSLAGWLCAVDGTRLSALFGTTYSAKSWVRRIRFVHGSLFSTGFRRGGQNLFKQALPISLPRLWNRIW